MSYHICGTRSRFSTLSDSRYVIIIFPKYCSLTNRLSLSGFTFLPIHAAGHHGPANQGSRLSEFAIPPTFPASARSRCHRLEKTPNQHRRHGGRTGCTLRATVCRTAQTPLESGLLLAHKRRLRVSDIVGVGVGRSSLSRELDRVHRDRARSSGSSFAFLSACQMATGDEQLTEESVHVAAGMLLAGYGSIVATMWSIWTEMRRVSLRMFTSVCYLARTVERAGRESWTNLASLGFILWMAEMLQRRCTTRSSSCASRVFLSCLGSLLFTLVYENGDIPACMAFGGRSHH